MFKDVRKFIVVIKKIYEIFDVTDRRKSFLVLVDILLCAILETIGVSLILPFISALSTPDSVYDYPVVGRFLLAFNVK